jgi:hypothetical protein
MNTGARKIRKAKIKKCFVARKVINRAKRYQKASINLCI